MTDSLLYWKSLESLVRSSEIRIVNKKDSIVFGYPQIKYPVDYAYLDNTESTNTSRLGCFLGSMDGEWTVTGVITTVDVMARVINTRLLLMCTQEEITMINQFLLRTGVNHHLTRRYDKSDH